MNYKIIYIFNNKIEVEHDFIFRKYKNSMHLTNHYNMIKYFSFSKYKMPKKEKKIVLSPVVMMP